ncbi:MAG: hypothetical protein IPP59_09330 [Betaproteobacteria bacterium]|nr:hypothetical protein [Candidatus Dechloromonas phosphorivorans]
MTEWISRYGRRQALPRWLKWTGWPFVAFVCTTVGQLVSVYQISASRSARPRRLDRRGARHPPYFTERKAHLGAATCLPGLGRLHRSSPKIAPTVTKVDRDAWDRHQGDFEPVNCARSSTSGA